MEQNVHAGFGAELIERKFNRLGIEHHENPAVAQRWCHRPEFSQLGKKRVRYTTDGLARVMA
ncbi:hypothetical protein AA23498_2624 [Acetobacter nitrogenifigens DSM 23921 = NBRC 105050]|nr:hypothetical protein AA23498_2624 [Acetobacter nitrogenifigens DSM 23921 = NBRC 105050]